MSAPLDEEYLTWLYSQVASVKLKNPARTYWALLRQLYTKEFVWLIPNDDNRVEDGRNLRYEFLELDKRYLGPEDDAWLDLGCSMLEMLVALSRKLSFEAEGEPAMWFWHLIENLDLRPFTDRAYDDSAREFIDDVCDRVIWRQYAPSGNGGLFPLKNPKKDQREVEIWYQLSAYVIERL